MKTPDTEENMNGYYIEVTPIPKEHWYSLQKYEKKYKKCIILGFQHIPSVHTFPEQLNYLIEVNGVRMEVPHTSIILPISVQATITKPSPPSSHGTKRN